MLILSPDQKKVLDHILEWYKNDKDEMQFVALGGYAGTGKTTLIAVLRRELAKLEDNLKVGFASYTGKASRVLRSKLQQQQVILPKDTVGTIHSLIYSPIVNEKEEITGWMTKNKIDRNLIIIDEASMVDGMIWQHLLKYKVPIIVVGDHGQLPPKRWPGPDDPAGHRTQVRWRPAEDDLHAGRSPDPGGYARRIEDRLPLRAGQHLQRPGHQRRSATALGQAQHPGQLQQQAGGG